jgi:hypothetical protein
MASYKGDKEAVSRVLKALKAVQHWEHWHEIQLCALKEYAMSAEEFYRLLPEYQRFIALTVGYEGVGMLSTEVDKLWHAHILNTKRYYDFCQQCLGRMAHHLPCSSYILYGYSADDPCSIPPTCNVRNSSEDVSEIRDTILTAAENFYQAYTECYGIMPSPDVWERLALLASTEGITI